MHSRLVSKHCILPKFPPLKSLLVGWGGGGLFDYSVKPDPHFVKVKLGLFRLVTRLA